MAVAAIHLSVFAALGLFTDAGWRLLIIFIVGLGIVLTIRISYRIMVKILNK